MTASPSSTHDGPARPGMTTESTIRRLDAVDGYHRLAPGPGEDHRLRADLAEPTGDASATVVVRLLQVTDFQLADLRSPTRLEFLQRLADEPAWAAMVPSYRPQEFAVVAQVEAMARTVRGLADAGRPVDLVLTTGDNTDNQQRNELADFVALMAGGKTLRSMPDGIQPGTGVGGEPDPAYYHLDRDVVDEWKSGRGFPAYPGVLVDAAREFTTSGFGVPWIACFGNHDAMIQGRAPANNAVHDLLAGDAKPVALDAETRGATESAQAPAMELYQQDPARYSRGAVGSIRADPDRHLFTRSEFVHTMREHSVLDDDGDEQCAYYAYEPHPAVRLLVLDTTNPGGHVDGSVGAEQLQWLRDELETAQAREQLVVVASHHGLSTLTNGYVAVDEYGDARIGQDLPRALADEVADVLGECPNVAVWVSGHTHRNRVSAVPAAGGGFWQLSTSAMIDWPCQARLLEIVLAGEDVRIRSTMLDHHALVAPDDEPDALLRVASVGREIAANIFDGVGGSLAEGTADDRNVELVADVPVSVRKALASAEGISAATLDGRGPTLL